MRRGIAPRSAAVDGPPKADIHLHAESLPRLDRLVTTNANEAPYDWTEWVRRTTALSPGMPRLDQLTQDLPDRNRDLLDLDGAHFVDWVVDALEEAASEQAVLAEVRFGAATALRPGFMSAFREAEGRVRKRYPGFYAEALISGVWPSRAGALGIFEACLRATDGGLAGIDFIPEPYASEADWTQAYLWAGQAAKAGLGITAHAGEFSPANIAAAIGLPGLTRIGHAVHAAASPQLLKRVAGAGVTVECCITSNQVLGAVPGLEAHPIRLFAEAAVPVTVNTDDPVRLCTTISREYEKAEALGFGPDDLLSFTRNAITASFTSEKRRAELLCALEPALKGR